MTTWTPEREKRLAALADGSLSASEIAKRLGGVSHNAVIGKIMRGKGRFGSLPGRLVAGSPRRPTTPRPARKPKQPRAARPKEQPVAPEPLSVWIPEFAPLPASLAVVAAPMSFMEAVERGRCLFFAGDPFAPDGPDMPVCGCERSHRIETRYCPRHEREQVGERRAA